MRSESNEAVPNIKQSHKTITDEERVKAPPKEHKQGRNEGIYSMPQTAQQLTYSRQLGTVASKIASVSRLLKTG